MNLTPATCTAAQDPATTSSTASTVSVSSAAPPTDEKVVSGRSLADSAVANLNDDFANTHLVDEAAANDDQHPTVFLRDQQGISCTHK